MKLLGKSKVITHKAKPEITYSLVRLPKSETEIAGKNVHIFKTDYNGKPVYVISLDEDFDGELQVTQPIYNNTLESRVESLEKQLKLLQKSASGKSESLSGPGEVRTPDLRRVKATS
jgi:hypothetical protein